MNGKRPIAVRARTKVLSVPVEETTFEARGYHRGDPGKQAALEGHAATFVGGYNAAIAAADLEELRESLARVSEPQRGFAYEGSGMALAVLDLMTLGRGDRLGALLRGHGAPHVYTVSVGAGWALARLRMRPRNRLRSLDPFLRWLALDGYGFHEGSFRTRRTVGEQIVPRRLKGYERNAFDQGLGRAVWFIECADVERIGRAVAGFDESRHADLWGGVGLACSYTLTARAEDLERLKELAGRYRPHLASGAVFAAMTRQRAGNLVEHTRNATELLAGCTVGEAAEAADRARADLGADPTGEGYERWRARVRDWIEAGAPPQGSPHAETLAEPQAAGTA